MAKVRFNEDGQVINADTGEVIGETVNGRFVMGIGNSQGKTLQEIGVGLPQQLPDQEEIDIKQDINRNDNQPIKLQQNIQVDNKDNNTHIDHGKSSFDVKRTKYQVTSDSYFIIKFGLLQKQDGHFACIRSDAIQGIKNAQLHWVKFRMWNYDQELRWKQQCTEYNSQVKLQLINNDRLNEIKIKNLLLDWSFGQYADRLKLLHCDNKLSDESYSVFKGMLPSIATTIVDLMNYVLQNNQ